MSNKIARRVVGSGIRNYDPAGKLQAPSLTTGLGCCRM